MTYRIFIARRLKKLGLLELKDGHYILPSTETEGTWLTEYTEEEAEREFPNIAKYNTQTDLVGKQDATKTAGKLREKPDKYYMEYNELRRQGLLDVKDGYYIRPSAEAVQLWIPVSDIRKLQDILLMKINSFEGTRNTVEKGMLEAVKTIL